MISDSSDVRSASAPSPLGAPFSIRHTSSCNGTADASWLTSDATYALAAASVASREAPPDT